ncbi:hypothetical protein [Reyranella sp.]|uniref:hypothetical protein n=1 Tax=Reyranella sp. TaxID=1929291 RepID=UPI002731A3D8|nr:hypothetical protein [Reyranella sp.]MDP2376937.1 hypothetical protein [Reyranella sp.]
MVAALAVEALRPAPSKPLTLSHRNHFKFGYNGEWFTFRRSPQDKWGVAYGHSEWVPQDWRAECIKTARLIRDNADGDLCVLFSGGLDSEVVVQSFLFAGIPIKVGITRFANQLNRHDMVYAVKFCEMHGIPYRCLDIDIEKFFESGDAWRYAERTKCVQPQLLHTMWAMDRVDGYPILGSGECYLVRRDPAEGTGPDGQPIWDMYEKERIASWFRHLMLADREGCAGFFQYNPENMLSFLKDPLMVELCSNRRRGHATTMKLKEEIYRNHFLLERRKKYHGFENVMHLDDRLRPELERAFGDHNGIVRTSYPDLLEMLAP